MPGNKIVSDRNLCYDEAQGTIHWQSGMKSDEKENRGDCSRAAALADRLRRKEGRLCIGRGDAVHTGYGI